MAEHDDVLHLERGDAEFERGRNAVRVPIRRIGRHDVGDVAHHEDLARACVEDHLWGNAGIRATDQHDLRRLAGAGEVGVAVLFLAQPRVEEGAVAVDKLRGQGHGLNNHVGCGLIKAAKLKNMGKKIRPPKRPY